MPQILYLLHTSRVWIHKHYFIKIGTIFRKLIWKNGLARIRLRMLQLPKGKEVGEGLALPHPISYFLAAQMQHMRGSNLPSRGEMGRGMTLLNTCHETAVEAVKAASFSTRCPTVQLLVKCGKTSETLLGYKGFMEYSILWDNDNLQELNAMGKVVEYERCSIYNLAQMYSAEKLK